MSRFSRLVRLFILTFVTGLSLQFFAEIAEARAGGRRSMGRSSRPAQSEQYRQNPQPGFQQQPNMPQQRGGFGRALAGGIAGGFLGSMLFSSMAGAAPGTGGLGGSGIGLIEILLLGVLAFLIFRWWKSRQLKTAPSHGAFGQASGNFGTAPYQAQNYNGTSAPQNPGALGTGSIDSDEASDLFFQVQAAFTRRDLSAVNAILSPDMYRELTRDIEDLKAQKRINRLENISVRRVDILDRWNEGGAEHARVRFTASLLDYTVDEVSGQVIEGDAHQPVKFEEDWTFARTSGYAPWQLVGIGQV